jgi:hypothetical protein
MYQCPECGKEYGSKSGLRRHRKRDHRPQGLQPLPVEIEPEEPEEEPALGEGENYWGPDAAEMAWSRGEGDEAAFRAAVKALGIEWHHVVAWKVYPDRVVIVEGPVGYKRFWQREE